MEDKTVMTFKLSYELYEQIKNKAKELGITKSGFIRMAILEMLKDVK